MKKLYRPLVYHLFGSFDVVFISLIDNYKFCQKIFNLEPSPSGKPINFQIVIGSCLLEHCCERSVMDFKEVFPSLNDRKKTKNHKYPTFTHITNFKINNGLLIGNGIKLIEAITKKLNEKLSGTGIKYLIVNSFNWAEITLIQLGDSLKQMQQNVINFRELALHNIDDHDEIAKRSLYGRLKDNGHLKCFTTENNYDLDDILQSHLFVDTHSYSGVHYDLFNAEKEQAKESFKDIPFKSSIEIQVKPGHFKHLKQFIETGTYGEYLLHDLATGGSENLFEVHKLKFKNGKTDYLVKEKKHEDLYSNYVINKTYKAQSSDFRNHIRKVKTNYLFDITEDTLEENDPGKVFGKPSQGIKDFGKFIGQNFTIEEDHLKDNLKTLGVSRHLREKVIKAIYNYNNIIQDVILYNEFIELRDFLKYILKDIDDKAKIVKYFFTDSLKAIVEHFKDLNPFSISELEQNWLADLDVFEEAYNNRVHNNYLYEDINEFSIDFNSAINQINAIQDFTVKTFNNVFFPKCRDQIIVTQNEIESKSNVLNVNYNVYHYMEPSLIFSSLMKEVLNGFKSKAVGYHDDYFTDFGNKIKGIIDSSSFSNSVQQLIQDFNFEYFFSDLAKYIFTFLYDYDLYYHWTWTYFLQNTNVYTAIGLPDERLLNQELLRVSLINEIFNPGKEIVQNPIPELFHYWQKNIGEITPIAKQLVTNDYLKSETRKFLKFIFKVFSVQNSSKLLRKINEYEYPNNDNFDDGIKKTEQLLAFGDSANTTHEISRPLEKSKKILKLIHKKSLNYKKILSAEQAVIDHDLQGLKADTFIYISAVSHATLLILKDEMGNNLDLLRRDWNDGQPNIKFIKNAKNTLLIDSCGGFFSTNLKDRRKQFGIKNAIILSLWNKVSIDKLRLFYIEKPE